MPSVPPSDCSPAISTQSLGYTPPHSLPHKLHQASLKGFAGIELFYDDLASYALTDHSPPNTHPANAPTPDALHSAARAVRALCADLNLTIVCLQPLRHFEGLTSAPARSAAFDTARLYISLAQTLGTDLLAASSSFLPSSQTTGSIDTIVNDFCELANLAARADIRVTFEALAWGTHISTWEESWAIVSAVNRPNFGICLDTFNILGRVYADPTQSDGIASDGIVKTAASLRTLRATFGCASARGKIFYIQVVDAERLAQAMNPEHLYWMDGWPERMMWSRNCRLFYGEQSRGAYLPVEQVLREVFGAGWRGWVSMELFHRGCGMVFDGTVDEFSGRGWEGWRAIVDDFPLVVDSNTNDEQCAAMPAVKDEHAVCRL